MGPCDLLPTSPLPPPISHVDSPDRRTLNISQVPAYCQMPTICQSSALLLSSIPPASPLTHHECAYFAYNIVNHKIPSSQCKILHVLHFDASLVQVPDSRPWAIMGKFTFEHVYNVCRPAMQLQPLIGSLQLKYMTILVLWCFPDMMNR